MPAAVPLKGSHALVKFTPSGGSELTLKNSHWTMTRAANIGEAPNTSDGMLRIGGLDDASGNVNGFWDNSNPINAQIVPKAIGVLKLYVDTTHFYTVTAIIGDVNVDTGGVNDMEVWSFPWMLQSGTVTDPTYP